MIEIFKSRIKLVNAALATGLGLALLAGSVQGQEEPPTRPSNPIIPSRPKTPPKPTVPGDPADPIDPTPPNPDPQSPPKPPAGLNPGIPGRGNQKNGDQLVHVKAVADVEQVRPGQTFHLAFIFQIEPRWHIYWKNQGANGLPTEIQVTAPPGYAIGKTVYPRPLALPSPEGVSYGYEDKTVLFVEATAPPDAKSGQVIFNAQVSWMVCKDVCMTGHAKQMVTVDVGSLGMAEPDSSSTSADQIVKDFQKRLPKPLMDLAGAETTFDGKSLTIKIPSQGKSTAVFFPLEYPGVTYGDATIKKEDEVFKITVPVTVNPNNALGKPMKIAGLVGIGNALSDPSYDFEIPLPAT